MKVLFGISNDATIAGIAKYYEEKYNEKIEYEVALYFSDFSNKIASGDYDRALLSEELDKMPTKSYAEADRLMFEYLDKIVNNFDAKDLILLCSERRKLGDEFLARLFSIGIYTTLTGTDRTKGKVCEVLHSPYTRRDMRKFYDNSQNKNPFNESEVSELELRKILTFFKNLNGDTSKYVEIFDRVNQQYNREQMAIIIRVLPKDVRDYLEKNSETYKSLSAQIQIQPAPQVQTQQPQPQQHIQTNNNNYEIKKGDDIAKQIVIKEVPKEVVKEKIVTQVVEKKVVEQLFDVPKDYRKTVIFVGAPKVGTSFCINAIGTYLAKQKIKTAIVDMTRKRDMYTIYTYDNTGKRNIAGDSMKYASNGKNEPLIYDKLSIYTAVPGEDRKSYNPNLLVETISKNNNVVLIDADFSTPLDYFRLANDIYIVQDMNILNVNQITMFLRELKQRGIGMEKVKIVINKYVDCSLSSKDIIDGIATYTSYDLKMFDELFNPKRIQYFVLPFNVDNYKKYIDMVYKYSNKFASFSKDFQENLNAVINSIYPTKGDVSVQEEHYTEESNKKSGGFGLFRRK